MTNSERARKTADEVRKTVQESTIADTYSLHDDVVALILSALNEAVKEKDEALEQLAKDILLFRAPGDLNARAELILASSDVQREKVKLRYYGAK